jgi:hypothetical protein
MGLITKYKLFERGDGVEEDDVLPPRKLQLDSEGRWSLDDSFTKDYILAVPSGEAIMIDDINVFKKIIDKQLAYYTYSYKEKILNCYVCKDTDTDKIREYIDDLKKDLQFDEGTLNICKDFRAEMCKVLKKNHVIGYLKQPLREIFYYIIPDLSINKNYYKDKIEDIHKVVANMMTKYGKFFEITDRVVNQKVKYYGLPSTYFDSKKTPKQVCEEIRDKVMEITCQKYAVDHNMEGIEYYYFNIPQKIINFFDKRGEEKINKIIDDAKSKYQDMKIDWLRNFKEAKHHWESGIFVKKN